MLLKLTSKKPSSSTILGIAIAYCMLKKRYKNVLKPNFQKQAYNSTAFDNAHNFAYNY